MLPGDSGALLKHPLHLLAQRPDAPELHPGHLGVELALQRIHEADDLDEMGPGQQSGQCRDCFLLIKCSRYPDHIK